MAELSHEEESTAGLVESRLRSLRPSRLLTGLGGHGLLALYDSGRPGPSVMLRCELDGLPIPESRDDGEGHRPVSHRCGHDGHMAMMIGVASGLSTDPPDRGRVGLLFQPAEEQGEGAALVLLDPFFEDASFDQVFALHNLPGFPVGQIVIRDGPLASASEGMIVELRGASSHAAEPEKGRSPAGAFSSLVSALPGVPGGDPALRQAARVTVIHARLGEIAFGTTPGEAVVMATLRASTDEVMSRLRSECEHVSREITSDVGIDCRIGYTQRFPATSNAPEAVRAVREAAGRAGLSIHEPDGPFLWSEDFGHFTARYGGALFGLGAGEHHPPLHHPDYSFPDGL